MPPSYDLSQQILTAERWLGAATAHAFEQRIASLLEEDLHSFVLGAESARVDCALAIGPDLVPIHAGDQVHIGRRERALEENRRILALDIKTITIGLMLGSPPMVRCDLRHTAFQREECAAWIVGCAAAPDWVALIPKCLATFLGPRGENLRGSYWPMLRYDDGSPSIPIRMTPFLLPISLLGSALENLRDCCERDASTVTYVNPYTEITFQLSRPTLSPARALLPADTVASDYPYIRSLQKGFQEHSTDYRIEIPRVAKAGGGDFIFFHLSSGRRAWVELKRGWISIPATGAYTLSLLSNEARPFSATLPYDFLLATSRSRAILLSRDEVPLAWQQPKSASKPPDWEVSPRLLARSRFEVGEPEDGAMVRRMTEILDSYRDCNLFNAVSPAGPPNIEPVIGDVDMATIDGASDDIESVELADKWGVNAYERQQGYMLRYICEENGWGSVVCLLPRPYERRAQPSGSHYYTPCLFSMSAHHEIPPKAPVIFINFCRVEDFFNRIMPRRFHPAASMASATTGRHKSFVIFTAVPENLVSPATRVWLVPSGALEDITEGLRLKPTGAPLDAYKVNDLEQALLRIRQLIILPTSPEALFFGDTRTGLGIKIDVKEYLTTQLAALCEIRDFMLHQQ